MILFFSGIMKSQVSVNINLGSPPLWGPVGYTETRYYYLPDIESYYDVQTSMFIYYYGGGWIHRTYLPAYYQNYDLYGGYKVVLVDYYGTSPYVHFKNHKVKYKKGYNGGPQKTIGQKPGKGNNKINSGGNNQKNHKSNGKNNNKSGGNNNKSKGNTGHGGSKGKK